MAASTPWLWMGRGTCMLEEYFHTAGGVSANYIARWDGAAWHSLGEGLADEAWEQPIVWALAVDGQGNLFAGGEFTKAGGVGANNIARWDGVIWHPLGEGLSEGADCSVRTLAVDMEGALYAGGEFFEWEGKVIVSYPLIARWDGVDWYSVGGWLDLEPDTGVGVLAMDGQGDLYVGGSFSMAGGVSASGIVRWDGVDWHPLGDGIYGDYGPSVLALAFVGQEDLFAGGVFTSAGGNPSYHIARWETAWAVDDRYRTPAGVILEVTAPGVLSNDETAEGDPLSAVLEEGPATGSLIFNPDGAFSYAPEANYIGLATFKYRISAEDGGLNSAEVTIEVFTRFYLPIILKRETAGAD